MLLYQIFFLLKNSVWLLNCWKCFVSCVKFIVMLISMESIYWYLFSLVWGKHTDFVEASFYLLIILFKEKSVWTVTEYMYNQENPTYYFEDFCHVFVIASILLLISEFSIHLAWGTFLFREKIEPIFILIGDYFFLTERVAEVTN